MENFIIVFIDQNTKRHLVSSLLCWASKHVTLK